ncbi:transcriptional regulator swi6 [Marasmius crinis-equi]|uniref:Transcriptional regulator swi6 n=1 Tax=Marasmius crinis-equi TaxID=585013 RepID=A0ABR3FLB9_9AGAR
MQSGRPPPSQPPVKIYNAVYSSVQVYECMVRGIAVMRRRGDSYVNATQILKVAGVDKGRRTKILEKEILPGKHEIVQGGYGKYQGTWIPLERGRDIAQQYGVLPLLAPLFDFTPSTSSLAALPVSTPNIASSPRPLSASSSYSSLGNAQMPGMLAPPPIMPGSALRLLNQGRAQGLFTPSTSAAGMPPRAGQSASPALSHPPPQSPFLSASQTPPPTQTLKRQRSDGDNDSLATIPDVQMTDVSRTPSVGPPQLNGAGEESQSPVKRLRKEPTPPSAERSAPITAERPISVASGKRPSISPSNDAARVPRFATKPSFPRNLDPTVPLKDTRRAAVISCICQVDDPQVVLSQLREITPFPTEQSLAPTELPPFDVDTILDEQGHTALHLAASLSRKNTVKALISQGADVHRGNHLGETPLMRTILSTHSFSAQSLSDLLTVGLSRSILTVDTSRKSVLHHILLVAGVKGRAVPARYYLDQIFMWIANQMDGDFACIVDLQDEHGDTALNIAARIGNRSMVRLLLDVGANRTLMNKLGLRPGDFGVESEELGGGPKAEDIASMLRSAPPAPVQKSQDVIADMTTMIQGLSAEFQSEIKGKQDALDVTQAHLRAATRELSEQRRQIQSWQTKCAELDLISQRMKNLEKAIEEEDMWDWTGRSGAKIISRPATAPREEDKAKGGDVDMDADASGDEDEELVPPIASTGVSPAFRYRGTSSTLVGGGTDMSDVASLPSFNVDPDPPIPTTNTIEGLIKLRRIKMWQARMEELMEERLRGLRGASAEKEYMCRRIVSLCTGVPVDKVEDMLDNLVVAVETEGSLLDIGRVSGFMQKVRDGII